MSQDYLGGVEVWISDDASTDSTGSVLAALEAEYPPLHVIQRQQNVGIAENASSLLEMLTTEFVVRLDSDDELERSYVRLLVEQMAAHGPAGYGHTAIVEVD